MTNTQNNKPKMGAGGKIIIGIISLLIVYYIFNLGNDKKESSTVKSETIANEEKKIPEKTEIKPDISLTSSELYNAYEANEVAADNKYKDKILEVTGKVSKIYKNPIKDDEIIVKLNGLKDNEYEIMGIDCHFDSSHTEEAANLSEGQKITIIGKCKKEIIGIDLNECTIKK